MTNQPNIFNYATSELTQDAFITWLLHWANPKYKAENEYLHHLGTSFLTSLLSFQNIELTEDISNFKIKQQFHKIDVFVTFQMLETTYGIIIEDKVHTIDHNNQLERYKTKITELKSYDVLIPIYFKTGYQVNQSRIKENGYHYYSLKDFLKLISQEKIAQINNDVLTQYYSYLLKKEVDYDKADEQANNYLTKPIKDWTWWTCIRFFHEYKKYFDAGWGEVANNREPLVAFWFGGRDFKIKDFNDIEKKIILYMDIVFINHTIEVNYRIGLKGTEINARIKEKIYTNLLPYLNQYQIHTKKTKYAKAKETMLLTKIINIDTTMHYDAFVKQLDVYKKVINEFADKKVI